MDDDTGVSDRYRALIEAMDDAFCVLALTIESDTDAVSYRLLEANSALLAQPVLLYALIHHQRWRNTFRRITGTRIAERFEFRTADAIYRYDVRAFAVDEPTKMQVAVLFRDLGAGPDGDRDTNDGRDGDTPLGGAGENSATIAELTDAAFRLRRRETRALERIVPGNSEI